MPEVSVILPVYNRSKLVCDAIDSVLAQTFEDYELIVVDDGSTDGTADAVISYDDPRITLLRHESNKGLLATRNTGVARASGRYVAALDSDDLWRPAKLERQVAAMRTRQWSASCTWYSKKTHGKPEERRWTRQSSNWFWTLLFNNILGGSTLMVERVWYDRVGPYDETLRYCGDTDWLLRFLRHSNFQILEEDLSVARRYDESSVSWRGDDPFARFREIWMTQADGRPRLTARESRHFRAGLETGGVLLSLRTRNYPAIVRHATSAFLLSPTSFARYCIERVMVRVWARLDRRGLVRLMVCTFRDGVANLRQ